MALSQSLNLFVHKNIFLKNEFLKNPAFSETLFGDVFYYAWPISQNNYVSENAELFRNSFFIFLINKPGFHPWVGKIPWRRECQPTPVFLPGEFRGQRSLAGYSPWSGIESDMTEQLTHTLLYLENDDMINKNLEIEVRIWLD